MFINISTVKCTAQTLKTQHAIKLINELEYAQMGWVVVAAAANVTLLVVLVIRVSVCRSKLHICDLNT